MHVAETSFERQAGIRRNKGAVPGMIIEETIEFLSQIPPFQFLEEEILARLASSATMEFYPKGSTILHQEGPPSEYLRVIKKGATKVFIKPDKGEEVLIDYRSEGDSFGFLSLVGGDKSRATVVAVEDTICLLIKKETVVMLLDSHPTFTEYFLKSFLNKYIDKAYQEMRTKSLVSGGGDKMLFTTPVGELATKEVVTARQEISIREAAELMSAGGISSLVIVDDGGSPVGIITDRDLRDKVVARGKDVEGEVGSIMSVALIKSEARDYCFDALLRMIRFNIHHLLVVDEGRLKGVVTNHDLMMLQGTSPISIVREIESQNTIEGLVPASKKISGMVTLLLKEGGKASNITRIITEINDRLERKIMEIAETKFGPPPVSYCWIVYGSEGRKEQTFKTDQDNAIIYADPKSEEEDAVGTYFANFAEFVKNALISCGFPVCTGGYMASNPKWRQPLRIWKSYFSEWITTPTPDAILSSVILFDFRPVYGDFTLAEKLRDHLLETIKSQDMFLAFMADMTISLRPPLGFFRTFVVEKSGEHKDKLNLKFRCIAPLIDIVRLYSLEKGVAESSTLERIDALRSRHSVIAEYGDELEHAFEFISLLRIHHQFDWIEAGLEPDNFIDPNQLGNLERRMLKESCQLISRIQDAIAKQYKPGTVM
jgi:CBS domain-containing protein